MTPPEDDGTASEVAGERDGPSEFGTETAKQERSAPARDRESTEARISDRNPKTPPPTAGGGQPEDDEPDEIVVFLRDIAVSILAVLFVGIYIFMISGVWPPMVAIESGSMEPNMEENDLVFVMESNRFQPSDAHGDTGVVTAHDGEATGYEQFGGNGDVIVFNPQGNERVTPIIHRAMFWVEEGENWCDRADEAYITDTRFCSEASHAGFITKGDDNPTYDQAGNGQLDPVRPEWVVGTAEIRIQNLGWLRLQF